MSVAFGHPGRDLRLRIRAWPHSAARSPGPPPFGERFAVEAGHLRAHRLGLGFDRIDRRSWKKAEPTNGIVSTISAFADVAGCAFASISAAARPWNG